jgi:hypothetical protein
MTKVAEISLRFTHKCQVCGEKLRKVVYRGKTRYFTKSGKRHYASRCNMPPNTVCTGQVAGATALEVLSNPELGPAEPVYAELSATCR